MSSRAGIPGQNRRNAHKPDTATCVIRPQPCETHGISCPVTRTSAAERRPGLQPGDTDYPGVPLSHDAPRYGRQARTQRQRRGHGVAGAAPRS